MRDKFYVFESQEEITHGRNDRFWCWRVSQVKQCTAKLLLIISMEYATVFTVYFHIYKIYRRNIFAIKLYHKLSITVESCLSKHEISWVVLPQKVTNNDPNSWIQFYFSLIIFRHIILKIPQQMLPVSLETPDWCMMSNWDDG